MEFIFCVCYSLEGHSFWVPTAMYDTIVSNPPVNRGKKSKTYNIPPKLWDGLSGVQGQISIQAVFRCADCVRGTPYASDARPSSASASDSRLPSAPAPATSSLFRNAFSRMTSYATRSRPASTPDRMMSQDSSSRPDISSDPPSVYDTLTRHVCCTLHVFPNFGLISYIHYFVY